MKARCRSGLVPPSVTTAATGLIICWEIATTWRGNPHLHSLVVLVVLEQKRHSHVAPKRPVFGQRGGGRRRQLEIQLFRKLVHVRLRGEWGAQGALSEISGHPVLTLSTSQPHIPQGKRKATTFKLFLSSSASSASFSAAFASS